MRTILFFICVPLILQLNAQELSIVTPTSRELEVLKEKYGGDFYTIADDMIYYMSVIMDLSNKYSVPSNYLKPEEVDKKILEKNTENLNWFVIARLPSKSPIVFSPVDIFQFYDYFLPEIILGLWEQQDGLDDRYPCPSLLEFTSDSLFVWNECESNQKNLVSSDLIEFEYAQLRLTEQSTFNDFSLTRLNTNELQLEKDSLTLTFKRK